MDDPNVPERPERGATRDRQRRQPSGTMRSLAATGLLLIGFGAGVAVNSAPWDGGDAGAASSFTDSPDFQVLQETWDLVHDEYVDGEWVDDTDLIHGAAAGMIESLGDTNHSRFLAPDEVTSYNQSLRGELIGIGVYIDYLGPEPEIVVPMEGTPADRAGIESGDIIVQIDGQPTRGLDSGEVSERLRGEVATEVTVVIEREGAPEPLTITLVREKITVEPVTWGMLPDGIAHIRLSQFSGGATDGLKLAIQEARTAGATGIVLDMRDNPGGLVFEAIGVASEFLPEGSVIFQEENRAGEINVKKTIGGESAVDLPLVVLVNGNSASAAEIVAGAIRDNDRGPLLGETTLGTGTVLSQYDISGGASVLLGTSLWLTAAGDQIWQVGVEPDETIEMPEGVNPALPSADPEVTTAELAATEDTQLQAAYDAVVAVASAP